MPNFGGFIIKKSEKQYMLAKNAFLIYMNIYRS
jgi:hypothetical protein